MLTKMNLEQRRFSTQMMRVAVETDPSAVQKVLREILRLPEERVQGMVALFERTTLESPITTTHSVLNRLDFLSGLRSMVFDPDSRRATAERRQLHMILEREAWLYLVVELKRPSVRLGKDELDQIEGYAIAISDDNRFNQPGVT